MTTLKIANYIANLKPYVQGKPLDELEREYGITNSIKLASNENPLGPSPKALAAMTEAMNSLHRYPDGHGYRLRQRIAEKHHIRMSQVVLGNGSNELIELLVRAFVQPGDEVIVPNPSFLMYEIMVTAGGGRFVDVSLRGHTVDLTAILDRVSSQTRMVFIANPNNPTGTIVSKESFDNFLSQVPREVIVVMDEAYIDFVRERACANSNDYLDKENFVVGLRTFSKAYGLAGLRIGYGIMKEEMTGFINRVRQPFNTSSLAQTAALAALDDSAFLEKTLQTIHEGLDFLQGEIKSMGLTSFPTQANFFLIDVKQDAGALYQRMLRKGVIVRPMTEYGYPTFIRVNAGLPEENSRFLNTLKEVL